MLHGECIVILDGEERTMRQWVAARYGASAATTTDDPAVAYADWRQEPWAAVDNPWPLDRSA